MDVLQLTETKNTFVQSKGWYSSDNPRPQIACNPAISLSPEANELLEHFQWCSGVDDMNALDSEPADVFLHRLPLVRVSDIDLEQAVLDKMTNNSGQVWDVHPCGDKS